MNAKTHLLLFYVTLFLSVIITSSCSKDAEATAPDVCSTANLTVTTTPTSTSACANDGAIAVTATGGTSIQYKIGNAAFVSTSTFSNLAAGTYDITVKNAEGCSKTAAVTIAVNNTAGTQFTAVKALLISKCGGCHTGAGSNGGFNFDDDCNIVRKKERINARSVLIGDMPQGGPSLTAAQKQTITSWIAAGGLKSN
jgi:mono/diheme cytochrome c family protein